MKKKSLRRSHHRPAVRKLHQSGNYLVMVRGWMFVVAFALMLGVGVIVGNYVRTQLDLATPSVAGATTAR